MNDLLILIALAVAPCIVIALFIYWRDKFDKEPFNLLVGTFFGGIASVVPAYFLSRGLEDIVLAGQTITTFEIAIDAFVCVAFAEEISKYFFLRLIAYPNKNFNEPFDGIMYSVMVGMGFAMIENLLYVLGNEGNGIRIALLRMFTAIPAHAVFAVIMGYFVGLAKHTNHKTGYLFLGVLAATLAHGFYDFFLFVQNIPFVYLGAAISLLFCVYLSFKAIRQHKKNSPFAPKGTNGEDSKITDSETGF
jgi:RsiW-degrading membrane proteinase PrsW (M82 family)